MSSIHTFVVLAYNECAYLENCIKSILNQSVDTNVIIATATPNKYIEQIAQNNNIKIIVNNAHKNIGGDFNFAIKAGNTELVTIAHQDDEYDYRYVENIINKYKQFPKSLILFTDYYEIKKHGKEYDNINLKVKRFLLKGIANNHKSDKIKNKRNILKFGNPICCPSVSFSKKNIRKEVLEKLFISNMKSNVDWEAWEVLSKEKGNFIYINKPLMGHRISEESTTSKIIAENIRTKEDLAILEKFWPKPVAKLINKVYSKSEQNNELK